MNNSLIKTEELTSIMGTFTGVVNTNTTSVAKCNDAGQAILDTIEGHGMTEELDQQASEYLKKVAITVKKMAERRNPITQLFDRIRGHFTTQEKAIDPKDPNTIPGKIVKIRNDYANRKYQEEQRRKQEAVRTANINNEKATYRRDTETSLLSFFNNYLSNEKIKLNQMFSEMALLTFERDANMIRLFSTEYPRSHFDKFTNEIQTYYIDSETKRQIRSEILVGKYDTYRAHFKQEIEAAKQYCIDRFGSKKNELQEIETLRAQDAEAARAAEEQKKQREVAEQARIAQENKQKEEQQKLQIEAAAQTERMSSLFDQSAATVMPIVSNAKVKQKIEVLHPNAFLEIFNMWWINEGQTLPIDELFKILKKQIAFSEKQANGKEPNFIQSKYIKYVDDVKAK